jgi:hypothetical protein
MEDVFEPSYSPKKIEFWLSHWEELDTLVSSPKASAHIAEHLNREWFLLQGGWKVCLCKELHDRDMVDPACARTPSGGGGFLAGATTALCILADLRAAADVLPAHWMATRQIWRQQMLTVKAIQQRVDRWRHNRGHIEREPGFARDIAVQRMAKVLGWKSERQIAA